MLCRGINIAVETNLYHTFNKIEPLIKKLNLLMFDIKIFDDKKHKKYTHMGNSLILENAKKTDLLGIPMIIRTPLIPGITDDAENLTETAEFISGMKNVLYYELLNFNPLGGSKYNALCREYEFIGDRPFSSEKLDSIAKLLSEYNIKIS